MSAWLPYSSIQLKVATHSRRRIRCAQKSSHQAGDPSRLEIYANLPGHYFSMNCPNYQWRSRTFLTVHWNKITLEYWCSFLVKICIFYWLPAVKRYTNNIYIISNCISAIFRDISGNGLCSPVPLKIISACWQIGAQT